MPTTPASASLPASAAIPQRTVLGDETIALGDVVLVASRSHPGFWYPVQDGRCVCEGFRFRHTCRHLEVARLAAHPEPATNTPSHSGSAGISASSASPALCSRCHKRPVNPRFAPFCMVCACVLPDEE